MVEIILNSIALLSVGFGLCSIPAFVMLDRRSKGEAVDVILVAFSIFGLVMATTISFVTYESCVAYASRPEPPAPYNLAVVAIEDLNERKVNLVNFLTKHTESKILIASRSAVFAKFDGEVVGKIPLTEGVHEQHELAYFLTNSELSDMKQMYIVSDHNMGYWNDVTVKVGGAMATVAAATDLMKEKPETLKIPEGILKAIKNRRVPEINDVGE